MASGQATGAKLRIYVQAPDKRKHPVFQGVNEQTGPAGSPDGVQGTVKANELPIMPLSSFVAKGGDKIVITGELTTADGLDASDSVFNVPIMRNGNLEYLSASDFGYSTDYPASTPASVELPLGAGYTVPEGDTIQVGGGTFFMSLENDTA